MVEFNIPNGLQLFFSFLFHFLLSLFSVSGGETNEIRLLDIELWIQIRTFGNIYIHKYRIDNTQRI